MTDERPAHAPHIPHSCPCLRLRLELLLPGSREARGASATASGTHTLGLRIRIIINGIAYASQEGQCAQHSNTTPCSTATPRRA
eukprot:7384003-Prymnesium_polylepis.1